jgi:CxxC motif-containing protein (DUF1111 family)
VIERISWHSGTRELIHNDWEQAESWRRGSAVPACHTRNDPRLARGGRLFKHARCVVRHVPQLRTAEGSPACRLLAGQSLRAYTDLLPHDMGEALADGGRDFQAAARGRCTPPCGGLAPHTQ